MSKFSIGKSVLKIGRKTASKSGGKAVQTATRTAESTAAKTSVFAKGRQAMGRFTKSVGKGIAAVTGLSLLAGGDNKNQGTDRTANSSSVAEAGQVNKASFPEQTKLMNKAKDNDVKQRLAAEKNARVEKQRHIDDLDAKADKAEADAEGIKHALSKVVDSDPGKKPLTVDQLMNSTVVKKYSSKNKDNPELLGMVTTIAKLLEQNNDLAYKRNQLLASKNSLDLRSLQGELKARQQESKELQKTIQSASSANADVAMATTSANSAQVTNAVTTLGDNVKDAVKKFNINSDLKKALTGLGPLFALAMAPLIGGGFKSVLESIKGYGEGVTGYFEGLGDIISTKLESFANEVKTFSNRINPFTNANGRSISDEAKEAEIDAAVKGVIAGNEAKQAYKAEKATNAANQMKSNSGKLKELDKKLTENKAYRTYWEKAEKDAIKAGDAEYAATSRANADKYKANIKSTKAEISEIRAANNEIAQSKAGKKAISSGQTAKANAVRATEEVLEKKGYGKLGKSAGKVLNKYGGKILGPAFAAFAINDFINDKDKEMAVLKLMSDLSFLGGPIGMVGGIMVDAIRTQIADKRQHMDRLYTDAIANDIDNINDSLLARLENTKGSPIDLLNRRFGGKELHNILTPLDHRRLLAAKGSLLSAYRTLMAGDPTGTFFNPNAGENISKLFVPWSIVQGRFKDLGIDLQIDRVKAKTDPFAAITALPITKGDNNFKSGYAETKWEAEAQMRDAAFKAQLERMKTYEERAKARSDYYKWGTATGLNFLDWVSGISSSDVAKAVKKSAPYAMAKAAGNAVIDANKWLFGKIANAGKSALGWLQYQSSYDNPIKKFATGSDLYVDGKYSPLPEGTPAIVGDGGKEERVVIGDHEFKTPSKPTLTYLPAGSIVEPTTARLQNKKANYIGGVPTLNAGNTEFLNLPKYYKGTLSGNYSDVVAYSMQRFIKAGFTPTQAAGIVGNLMGEGLLYGKGYGYEKWDVNGPSAGIAQFHDIKGKVGELSKLKAYANKVGKDWNQLDTQLDYLINVAIPERTALSEGLKNSKSVEDAAFHWGNKYEIFGPGRAYAQRNHPQYKIRSSHGHDALELYRKLQGKNIVNAGSWTGPGTGNYKAGTDGNLSNYSSDIGSSTGDSMMSGLSAVGGGILGDWLGDKFNVGNVFSAALSVTDKDLANNAQSLGWKLNGSIVSGQTPKSVKAEKVEPTKDSDATKPSTPVIANSGNTTVGPTTNVTNINIKADHSNINSVNLS